MCARRPLITAELESFDTKLAQRIQILSAQIESHTLQMANLRRKEPQQAAQNFAAFFEKQSEEYDRNLKADQENQLEAARATAFDLAQLERVEEIGETYQKGTEDLAALSSVLGGTINKMERAQRAAAAVDET